MTLKECINGMLKWRNKSQVALAEELSLNRQSTIANALSRGNMTVETLVKYCNACDYEVIIRPKETRGAMTKGAFVLDVTGPSEKRPRKKPEKKADKDGETA